MSNKPPKKEKQNLRRVHGKRTSVYLGLLHVLSGHRIGLDNLRKGARLEVLLAGLFLSAMLARVDLHALELVCPSTKLVLPLLEELACLFAHLDHPVWRVAEHLDDARDLVVLGRTGEERQAEEKLDDDAAQRPHVYRRRVRQAKQDFGRAVESRLDVRVYRLPFVAGRSKINNFDDWTLEILEEDILGLQIAVDQPRLVQQSEAVEKLLREDSDQRGAEATELVLLDQLVQIDTQQLEHQAQVLPMDEGVLEPQQVVVVVLVKLRIELLRSVSAAHSCVT